MKRISTTCRDINHIKLLWDKIRKIQSRTHTNDTHTHTQKHIVSPVRTPIKLTRHQISNADTKIE